MQWLGAVLPRQRLHPTLIGTTAGATPLVFKPNAASKCTRTLVVTANKNGTLSVMDASTMKILQVLQVCVRREKASANAQRQV